MSGISSNREIASSLPIWLGGMFKEEDEMRWYRIDLAVDNVFEQQEIRRLHRHRQQCRQCQREETTDSSDDNWEEDFVIPRRAPFHKSLGLAIREDSVLIGIHSPSSLAQGSFIVCAGGASKYGYPIATLHCLDTRNIRKGWKTCKMITPRFFPLVAALDGKIYIAGGTKEKPWGEVFDPVTHESKPLPPFPAEFANFDLPWFQLVGVLPNSKTLFFCSYFSRGYVLYYNIINQSWDCFFDPVLGSRIPCDAHRQGSAVVGTTMYWFSPGSFFFAYDYIECKVYSSRSMCEDFDALGIVAEWGDWSHPPTLLHLYGDYFCVVWNDGRLLESDYDCFTQVHCTKLEVHRIYDSECLRVSVNSSHTYLIHGLFDVKDALLMKGDLFTPSDGEISGECSLVGAELSASPTDSGEEVK